MKWKCILYATLSLQDLLDVGGTSITSTLYWSKDIHFQNIWGRINNSPGKIQKQRTKPHTLYTSKWLAKYKSRDPTG